MRTALLLLALVFAVFLATQTYRFYNRNRDLGNRLEQNSNEIKQLNDENKNLQNDIFYFSNIENLAKELKSKFDYKRPGEKLIKIQ